MKTTYNNFRELERDARSEGAKLYRSYGDLSSESHAFYRDTLRVCEMILYQRKGEGYEYCINQVCGTWIVAPCNLEYYIKNAMPNYYKHYIFKLNPFELIEL